jgi:hypothetical protein
MSDLFGALTLRRKGISGEKKTSKAKNADSDDDGDAIKRPPRPGMASDSDGTVLPAAQRALPCLSPRHCPLLPQRSPHRQAVIVLALSSMQATVRTWSMTTTTGISRRVD